MAGSVQNMKPVQNFGFQGITSDNTAGNFTGLWHRKFKQTANPAPKTHKSIILCCRLRNEFVFLNVH